MSLVLTRKESEAVHLDNWNWWN